MIPNYGNHTFTVLDGPQWIAVRTKNPPCKECGGAHVHTMEVGATGGSFGTGYDHADDCKTLFCPHGYRWRDWGECKRCHAEDQVRVAADGEDDYE